MIDIFFLWEITDRSYSDLILVFNIKIIK